MRPRSKSLMRGCVTPQCVAAAACLPLPLFLKGTKEVNRVSQTSCVDHPESTGVIPCPNFLNAFTDRRYRREIIRLHVTPHTIKLAARMLQMWGSMRNGASKGRAVRQWLWRLAVNAETSGSA